ncbi:MAG: hypothetical protein WEE64_14980 [Dehalococcoidia bacterium]
MIRKTYRITLQQDVFLRQRAQALGVSQSEIARQSIDATVRSEVSLRTDPTAWEQLRKDMEERAKIDAPQTGRSWTREGLYEERFDRYDRRS